LFTVSVRELERADQRRTWEVPPEWIDWALAESEARSDGTPGTLEAYIKKNGREVLVKGTVRAGVNMPCARTLEPVEVKLDAEILVLLTPKPPAAPAAPGAPGAPKAGRRQRGKGERFRAVGDEAVPEDPAAERLSAEQAARDEYEGDKVELDAFVREHLLLELPLFPVRSDLPFELNAATDTPPDEAGDAPVDPRLAPLAALASQMRSSKEKSGAGT
jgi:uncharacterized protein